MMNFNKFKEKKYFKELDENKKFINLKILLFFLKIIQNQLILKIKSINLKILP